MNTLYNHKLKVVFFVLLCGLISLNSLYATDFPTYDAFEKDAMEEIQVVEQWMSDLNAWNVDGSSTINFIVAENEFSIESWMLDANESNWNSDLVVDCEEELVLDNWMTDLSKW
jgi:hypothetical protein